MKTILLFIFLSTTLLSQTYMNILYTNSSSGYCDVNDIVEITFNASGTEMTTTLTTTSKTDLISDINEITFDATHNGNPLPVELTSFSCHFDQHNDQVVVLNWITATEVNNYGFEVERKILKQVQNDGDSWEKVGFVEGYGNSNSPKEYSFTDNSAKNGKYSYRLKQIDTDGTFEYSETIEVEIGIPTKFALFQNYPNPFNPSTTIEYQIPASGNVAANIYDITGRLIKTIESGEKSAGIYKVNWDSKNNFNNRVSSGIYVIQVKYNNSILTKKLMLLK